MFLLLLAQVSVWVCPLCACLHMHVNTHVLVQAASLALRPPHHMCMCCVILQATMPPEQR